MHKCLGLIWSPIAPRISQMSPEDTHKAIRIYIGGLILGVNTLYMLFCFFKLLAVVGKMLGQCCNCWAGYTPPTSCVVSVRVRIYHCVHHISSLGTRRRAAVQTCRDTVCDRGIVKLCHATDVPYVLFIMCAVLVWPAGVLVVILCTLHH